MSETTYKLNSLRLVFRSELESQFLLFAKET